MLAAARFSRAAWLATTMSRTAKGMAGVARATGQVHQGDRTVGLTAASGYCVMKPRWTRPAREVPCCRFVPS